MMMWDKKTAAKNCGDSVFAEHSLFQVINHEKITIFKTNPSKIYFVSLTIILPAVLKTFAVVLKQIFRTFRRLISWSLRFRKQENVLLFYSFSLSDTHMGAHNQVRVYIYNKRIILCILIKGAISFLKHATVSTVSEMKLYYFYNHI